MSDTKTATEAPVLFLPSSAEIEAMVHPTTKDLVQETEDLFRHGEWAQASANLKRMMKAPRVGTEGYSPAQVQQALGDCAMNLGMNSVAVTHYQEAVRLDPSIRLAHENLIFLLDAQPWTTDRIAKRARDAWWTHHGSVVYAQRQPHTNARDPEKRLRVGYVSADYRFHSAVIAFSSVVLHPSDQIETVFYSTLPEVFYDRVTQDWKAKWGPHFVDVSRLTPQTFAEVVRNDAIDILVDLSGYTAGNRLLSFACKPAPIQITAWGYATGTNCPAMDVLFADPIVASSAMREASCERVIDLPCVIGFAPRDDLPEPNPLPCWDAGPCFGVFQRASKLNDDVLAVFAKILRRVPESTILFKGQDYNPQIREWIARQMGSARRQVRFELGMSHLDHQHWYNMVDLSLDPWPQTGGVSTMESSFQGVPVLTLLGPRVIQRTTASINMILQLPDLITTTKPQYIAKAIELVTTGRDRLAQIRGSLRTTMQASPILVGYRDAVEAQYRSLWREWCAAQDEAAA